MEVEMKIRGLMMDPVTNMPIVILKDVNGNTVLPIWVGIYEANAIALEIEKVSTPRPMTHDLIKSLLSGLHTGIRKVVVSELKDDTFYALIWLDREGELISVDSRPSDALALALRLDCPIFVDDSVLKSSKLAATVSDKVNNEELKRWLEDLNDEDLGRTRCANALHPAIDGIICVRGDRTPQNSGQRQSNNPDPCPGGVGTAELDASQSMLDQLVYASQLIVVGRVAKSCRHLIPTPNI
jgi:bifunctional DNase/RNase